MYSYDSNSLNFMHKDILDANGNCIATVTNDTSAKAILDLLNQNQLNISSIEYLTHTTKQNCNQISLRPITYRDEEFIEEIFSDKKLWKYDDWSVDSLDIDEIMDDMCEPIQWGEPNSTFYYLIHSRATKIGYVSVNVYPYLQVEVGYCIAFKHQNNGYASNALRELIKLAKINKMHRVFCSIHPENIASIKTAQYNGMTQCAYLHHSSQIRGKWCDDVVMEKILR